MCYQLSPLCFCGHLLHQDYNLDWESNKNYDEDNIRLETRARVCSRCNGKTANNLCNGSTPLAWVCSRCNGKTANNLCNGNIPLSWVCLSCNSKTTNNICNGNTPLVWVCSRCNGKTAIQWEHHLVRCVHAAIAKTLSAFAMWTQKAGISHSVFSIPRLPEEP